MTPSVVFKPEQRASIKAVYEEKDVSVWLPTGFGKSVCYEALPFVELGTNAPCLALVYFLRCRARGVKAAITISSEHTPLNSVNIINMNNTF